MYITERGAKINQVMSDGLGEREIYARRTMLELASEEAPPAAGGAGVMVTGVVNGGCQRIIGARIYEPDRRRASAASGGALSKPNVDAA